MILYENRTNGISISKHNGFSFPSHIHHNLEIIICVKGELEITCLSETRTIKKGMLFIAFSNQPHSYRKMGNAECIMVIVEPEFLLLYNKYLKKRCGNNFYDGGKELIALANGLYSEYSTANDCDSVLGYLNIILSKAFRTFTFYDNKNQSYNNSFAKALIYISENYTADISLKDVAKAAGINHSHLSRLFNQNFSMNFLSYLQTLRIEYAKYLLKNKDDKISYIALESGFPSIRTFNRVFKSITGITPGQYRKV